MKPRLESTELKVYRSVNARMELEGKEKLHYSFLEKWLEGELKFDSLLERLEGEYLILKDILLDYQGNLFQIDTLIISKNTIHMFEVKNYEGDYYVDADNWFSTSGTEIKNPLSQLKRTESLFRRYLQFFRSPLKLECYLVFVNPEFTLLQAPLNELIILPTQLNRFLRNLEFPRAPLTNTPINLAKKILADPIVDSPYKRLPTYEYKQLEKGIWCCRCRSLRTHVEGRKLLICESCGVQEELESAILRSVEEFQVLFLNRKITTNAVQDWCLVVESRKGIRRVLDKHYTKIGSKKHTYFIAK
ncbi:nuclease-related domain-containing protein [Robertmurraya kyonggiensis]|uniref:NERD domain-containing protein n=1 Tax=Robertmurraya kyonggiensis TaxID=1037680 RepID=A0A4U1D145_9BACI|nr:nuclease-related domain-containing protein [Robertmurraya kyonggiensis]TKC14877.1 NERD domain-containing protein [Robertmurraya kyonggiensis]